MPEKVMPGPVQDTACIREAVCIHTKKIYDSCKEEDIAPYNKCAIPIFPSYRHTSNTMLLNYVLSKNFLLN